MSRRRETGHIAAGIAALGFLIAVWGLGSVPLARLSEVDRDAPALAMLPYPDVDGFVWSDFGCGSLTLVGISD